MNGYTEFSLNESIKNHISLFPIKKIKGKKYMNKIMLFIAEKILQHTQIKRGGTFLMNGDSAELNDGYMVSLDGYEQSITLNAFYLRQLGFVAKNVENFNEIIHAWDSKKNENYYVSIDGTFPMFIGTWIDDGKLVMDISIKVDSLKIARILAERFNQKAIFDNAKKESIFLD